MMGVSAVEHAAPMERPVPLSDTSPGTTAWVKTQYAVSREGRSCSNQG